MFMYVYVYACVLTCVSKGCRHSFLGYITMSGIKAETGDLGWRKAYGMDEDSPVGVN